MQLTSIPTGAALASFSPWILFVTFNTSKPSFHPTLLLSALSIEKKDQLGSERLQQIRSSRPPVIESTVKNEYPLEKKGRESSASMVRRYLTISITVTGVEERGQEEMRRRKKKSFYGSSRNRRKKKKGREPELSLRDLLLNQKHLDKEGGYLPELSWF
jgi:hypothetical protein